MTTARSSSLVVSDTGTSPGGLQPETRTLVVVLLAGAVLPLLDTTIVNVALDGLTVAFGSSLATMQWVVTGYAMATALAIPLSAWAVRRFGGKRVWLLALALFLAGSVLAAQAWDPASLIAFRAVQGFGGGMSMPVLQTLLIQSAGQQQARRAMAAIGIPAVVAPVAGPVLGGALLAGAGWQWLFYINVPICLLAIGAAVRWVPPTPGDYGARIDVRGLLTLAPAVVLLLLGLSGIDGRTGIPPAASVAAAGAGGVLLAVFVLHALRTSRDPLLDIRLFALRSFTGAAASMLLTGVVFYAGLVLLPLYYQQGRGWSVLGAGAVLGLQGVGALLSRYGLGRSADVVGPRAITIGGALVAALATLPFTGVFGRMEDPFVLAVSLVLRGAGIGLVTVTVLAAAYHGLERQAVPHASSIGRVLLQLGGATGAAGATVVLAISSPVTSPAGLMAFHGAFWWLTVLTAVIAAPAVLLPGATPEAAR